MDYNTKLDLVRALNDKFSVPSGDNGNTRYDANTGTIYSNTGKYTIADIDDIREKLADFSKRCSSHKSTLTLDPSYIPYCNMLDTILLLVRQQMENKKS